MRYNTIGAEPLDVGGEYAAAVAAVGAIIEGMARVDPSTAAWRTLAHARAEAENWARYLALGGYKALGPYFPLSV